MAYATPRHFFALGYALNKTLRYTYIYNKAESVPGAILCFKVQGPHKYRQLSDIAEVIPSGSFVPVFPCPFSLDVTSATSEVFHCYSYLFTLQRYGGQGYAKNHSTTIPS